MVHSISLGFKEYTPVQISSGIDEGLIPTIQALLQVNSEARKAVLAGREVQKIHSASRTTHEAVLHKCIFVNWEVDLFYFTNLVPFIKVPREDRLETWVSKIKHAAVNLNPLEFEERTVLLPDYDRRLAFTKIQFLSHIPFLETIHLAFSSDSTLDLFLHKRYATNPEATTAQLYEDFLIWLRKFPADQWGFHHIGPESIRCLRPDSYRASIDTPFLHWLNSTKSKAKKDAESFGKPNVDIQIVMDVSDGHWTRAAVEAGWRLKADYWDMF